MPDACTTFPATSADPASDGRVEAVQDARQRIPANDRVRRICALLSEIHNSGTLPTDVLEREIQVHEDIAYLNDTAYAINAMGCSAH
jgi:hypothetical protein